LSRVTLKEKEPVFVEGESLLNDGTAGQRLLLFQIPLASASGGGVSLVRGSEILGLNARYQIQSGSQSMSTRAFIDTNPTENDNLRVARDPPGIGIRQPLFAFPRHSFGEVIQIDMAS